MLAVAIVALVLIAVLAPQHWALATLRRHDTPREDFPGSGAELAIHLLRRLGLEGRVTVETSSAGDHYDPAACAVRLSTGVHDGRSLTAIVVAAHEVGHAVQHACGYRPLALRTRLAAFAERAQWIGALVMVGLPFIAAVVRVPVAAAVMFAVGASVLSIPVLVHLLTLPVEFDASFGRALPLLAGGYLEREDLPAARRILTACALTYVAAALATLLNVWRWIRILRR